MKNTDLLYYMGKIDDALISHAEIKRKKKSKIINRIIPIVAAACFMLVIGNAIPVIYRNMAGTVGTLPVDGTGDTGTAGNTENPVNSVHEVNGFVIEDSVLIDYKGTDTELVIPDEVKTIASTAFMNCPAASAVTSLATRQIDVEDGAFRPLTGLMRVDLIDVSIDHVDEAIQSALNSTVEELISQGIGLEYEYAENGGTPIYKVNNIRYDEIRVSFGDRDIENPLSMSERVDKVIITERALKIADGLFVGMTSVDAKALELEWDNIYWNTDSLSYYTVIRIGGISYTLAWRLTDEQFAALTEATGDTDYYKDPDKFLSFYRNDDIGELYKIVAQKDGDHAASVV